MSNAPQGDLGSAMIYYAFDNTVNSSRYPYYSYMKGFWTAMGLHTRIDSTVTVSDLKRMNDYGLCILSAHGSYYTYTSGFLFKQTRTEPVILLTEESDFYKDLYYGHRSADPLGHQDQRPVLHHAQLFPGGIPGAASSRTP